nr:MAG TPA: hypothetical protein [Caudoviricetes sp.]
MARRCLGDMAKWHRAKLSTEENHNSSKCP